jgi:hypothetical protein
MNAINHEELEKLRPQILAALEDPNYLARTIQDLAEAIGIDERTFVRTMKSDPELRGKLKLYPGRSENGELLLTTRDKFYKTAPWRAQFLDMFANDRASLDDVV